jgi:substrate-binding family protein
VEGRVHRGLTGEPAHPRKGRRGIFCVRKRGSSQPRFDDVLVIGRVTRDAEFQAGIYSAAMHYLKAVKAAGTDEALTVIAQMKTMPVNDFMTKNGTIREDGRMMRDMYLLQAKKPTESKGA